MFFAASVSAATEPVADEALRLAALRAIFPGAQISLEQGKKIDQGMKLDLGAPEKLGHREIQFPDAMAGEYFYQVIGKPMNRMESGVSEDIVNVEHVSNARQVRFKVFPWPVENAAGLLAVLQYDFPDAKPPQACPSIGLLVHLVRAKANWQVHDEFLLETVHHHSMQRVEMVDLIGDGVDELVVESAWGGAGTSLSSLQVFDLSHGRLEEVLSTESRAVPMNDDIYTQALDMERTRQTHGHQFCVTMTALFANGKWFKQPRVSHPCYERGFGVDPNGLKSSDEMLAPLH
jgi:hypothetical protein